MILAFIPHAIEAHWDNERAPWLEFRSTSTTARRPRMADLWHASPWFSVRICPSNAGALVANCIRPTSGSHGPSRQSRGGSGSLRVRKM